MQGRDESGMGIGLTQGGETADEVGIIDQVQPQAPQSAAACVEPQPAVLGLANGLLQAARLGVKPGGEADLRQPEGAEIMKRLVATADVVCENFRPGTFEKWGLGYDVLSKINPKLVMIRVSGYGQTGPYAKKAGYGAIGEAMGGLRYVVGDPSTPPSRRGISIGDTLAATFGLSGDNSSAPDFVRAAYGRLQQLGF